MSESLNNPLNNQSNNPLNETISETINEIPDKSRFTELMLKINKNKNNDYYDDFITNDKKIQNIVNNTDIDSLRNSVKKQISSILKIQTPYKFVYEPDALTEDEMKYLENFIKNRLTEILKIIDTLAISDVRDIYNYVDSIQTLLTRTQNPSSCDVISVYIKYSRLIHLLLAFHDENLIGISDQDMFENNNLNLDTNFIFTKCFASVSTIRYLLGGNTNIGATHIKPDDLKKMIISLKTVPSYCLDIGVGATMDRNNNSSWDSNFNHIFSLIKYQDNIGNNYYYLAQSYFFKYCPITKKYSLDDILVMIDEIASIYYDKYNQPRYGEWDTRDNAIWEKYFLADETKYIGKTERKGSNIKMHDKCRDHPNSCYCFEYTYNVLDINNCYDNIIRLLSNCEDDVNNCFDNICRNFLSLFSIDKYERPFIIDAVRSNKFIKSDDVSIIINNNDITLEELHIDTDILLKYGKDIDKPDLIVLPIWDHSIGITYDTKEDIPKDFYLPDGELDENIISKNWSTFKEELMRTRSRFILDRFDVNTYEQCLLFLNILSQFYDLKKELIEKPKIFGPNSHFTLTDHTGGKINHHTTYVKNKLDYQILRSFI